MGIKHNVQQLLGELPEGISLLAAVKARTPDEIREAVASGVRIIGENYVQEAEKAYQVIGNKVEWHFIGHLQKNKVKRAVQIFDMIETIDSVEVSGEINKGCAQTGKTMPVLVEINSGREPQKSGVLPEYAEGLIRDISTLRNIRVTGLMTMGPHSGKPDDFRPYFAETRRVFTAIKSLNLPGVEMRYLSMGMTNSYRVALEEGANIVRIGSKIFGEKNYP